MSAKRSFSTALTSLDGAVVRFCQGASCSETTVDAMGLCKAPEGFFHQCFVSSASPGQFEIELSFILTLGGEDEPKDGETYTFTLFSPADPSMVLVEATGKAKFEPFEVCMGAPCYNAKI